MGSVVRHAVCLLDKSEGHDMPRETDQGKACLPTYLLHLIAVTPDS